MSKQINSNTLTFKQRNALSGGYLLRKRILAFILDICFFLLMFGLCFLIIQPILNKISLSLMAESDLYDSTINLLPRHFTISNFGLAAELMEYGKAFRNSLLISGGVSLVQLIACTLVGYGFARFEFPLKKFWFFCVILVIVIPPQTISSALHLHFYYYDFLGLFKAIKGSTINLRGSMLPYFLMSAGCMGLKDGLYIYLIRQYFRGVPKELEEAAYVDGCGTFSTFVRIMLPDAKPILVSCFLFSFVWQWTDSFYSNLFLGRVKLLSRELGSLADSLSEYVERISGGASRASVGYMQQINAVGVLMVVTPIILLYLVAQRGFVESLSQTGIKM